MSPRLGHNMPEEPVVDKAAPVDSLNLVPEVDVTQPEEATARPPQQIVWRNVILMSAMHLGALYGLTLLPSASWATIIFSTWLKPFYGYTFHSYAGLLSCLFFRTGKRLRKQITVMTGIR